MLNAVSGSMFRNKSSQPPSCKTPGSYPFIQIANFYFFFFKYIKQCIITSQHEGDLCSREGITVNVVDDLLERFVERKK